jgi:hypothetical protein
VATLVHKMEGRRFFVTGRGFMGFGPQGIESGDTICVLLGCDVPLILRKVDKHYVLRGECFMLGLMDGEAIDALDEGIMSLEEVEVH